MTNSINNGKPLNLDLSSLSILEKEKYATAFAEGCADLQDLLLFLWRNNIHTTSCCAGHLVNDKMTNPYIVFQPQNISKDVLLCLLDNFFNNPYFDNISFSMVASNIHTGYGTIGLHLKNNTDSFRLLKNDFQQALNKKYTKPSFFKIYNNLSPGKQNFYDNLVLLKNMKITDIDLSFYKQYYKHLPSSPYFVSINCLKKDAGFYFGRQITPAKRYFNPEVSGTTEYCEIAYTFKQNEDKYYMYLNENIVEVSPDFAKQFMEVNQYENLVKSLFSTRDLFLKAIRNDHS